MTDDLVADTSLPVLSGSVLSHIGVNGGAVGKPYVSTPYHGHAIVQASHPSLPPTRSPEHELTQVWTALQWVVDNLFTEAFWIWYNRKLHVDIRERVIRKKAREVKAAKQE